MEKNFLEVCAMAVDAKVMNIEIHDSMAGLEEEYRRLGEQLQSASAHDDKKLEFHALERMDRILEIVGAHCLAAIRIEVMTNGHKRSDK